MDTIISRNPATGAIMKTFNQTPVEDIPAIVQRARQAQQAWADMRPNDRRRYFINAREYILDNIDSIADLICQENGKPRFEAIVNDILPALDLLSQYSKRAPALLRDKSISLKFMHHRRSYLNFWPKGVVAIIAPWNYPFSIPFGEITLGLLAGNAVIFKPSEATPQIGLKIVEIFEQATIPKNLLQAVVGDATRGAALIKSDVDKVFFTGSVATGKKVMEMASEALTPIVLELGGKDPMIVLQNADLDLASSAALWGGFSNSGQACASVERIIVHESVHDDFVSRLAAKLGHLRREPQLEATDLGVITYEKQKVVYDEQLSELTEENSKIVTGGKFSTDRTFFEPTIITNPPDRDDCPLEKTRIYRDETFGPIVTVTKFKTVRDAIQKANDTRFGLSASIFSRDNAMAEQVARQIHAGSVLINEVLYTHGLSETPWGGLKESGFGRVHSDLGFLEFVNVRHIHKPRTWVPTFKSLWWFPYSKHQTALFRHFMEFMFRRSITRKLKALPNMLVELVNMIKVEKRL